MKYFLNNSRIKQDAFLVQSELFVKSFVSGNKLITLISFSQNSDLIMDVKVRSLLQDYLNQDNYADYISASYQSVTILRGWWEFLTTRYPGQVLL